MNNAAYRVGEDRVPIVELDPDVFQRVVDVKVRGTYLCTKAAVKPMVERGEGGKIVNISSTAGKRGSANTLAYNAANFAVVGMTLRRLVGAGRDLRWQRVGPHFGATVHRAHQGMSGKG